LIEAKMTLDYPQPPGGEQQLFPQLSFPEIYEQALVGPLFRPWAELMLEDVELRAGNRVLDIACGTGIVARLAKERLGETGAVVGVDVNPQMLAVAQRVAPAIDWRQGEASTLPLRDNERFDVIVCQQGLQFFSDRAAAACQMHRALAAHGRLAVSTWCPDEQFPVLRQLRGVVERHLGPIVDRRHSFGEAGALERLLREAGFRAVRSKTVSRSIRFDDGSVFVRLNAMALVSMSRASAAMSDEERQRIVLAVMRDSAELVRLHTDGTGFVFELGTNVTMATA
jgi:ubiquinone/menaquinone biosynthesis C-methylase UbiE